MITAIATAMAASVVVTEVPIDKLQSICHGPAGACAFWRDRSRPCRIYMPRVGDQLPGRAPITRVVWDELMAHELEHCRRGVTHAE